MLSFDIIFALMLTERSGFRQRTVQEAGLSNEGAGESLTSTRF